MELTDFSGMGQAFAEVRELVLGLAQLYCERKTRQIINEGLALKNVITALEIVNDRKDCLKPTDLQELLILQELRATLEELRAMRQASRETQDPGRFEADAPEVDRSNHSQSQRLQTTEIPSDQPGTRRQRPPSANVIRKVK